MQAAVAAEGEAPAAARAEAWMLLRTALCRYLRLHASRGPAWAAGEVEDLASEKTLDLLRQIESGKWEVRHDAADGLAGFLSTVSRNALIDEGRRAGRRREALVDVEPSPPAAGAGAEPADRHIERREFAAALRSCVSTLDARGRLAWFFRVLCDMSSAEIAVHPEIQANAAHVDVILQRCRERVSRCLESRGFGPGDLAPGAFFELWLAFRATDGREDAQPR